MNAGGPWEKVAAAAKNEVQETKLKIKNIGTDSLLSTYTVKNFPSNIVSLALSPKNRADKNKFMKRRVTHNGSLKPGSEAKIQIGEK